MAGRRKEDRLEDRHISLVSSKFSAKSLKVINIYVADFAFTDGVTGFSYPQSSAHLGKLGMV